jgi:nucleotide-binding universal stress UspA family protein
MNFKNVLFPTDLSDYNGTALAYASVLAAESGAKLHILHVDDMQDISAELVEFGYVYPTPWDDNERAKVREELNQITPAAAHVPFEHHYLRGAPARTIIEFAESQRVDLIVMASHGRTGLARLVMGSVAEEVTRRAPCPVLIVKQPAIEHQRGRDIVMTVAQSHDIIGKTGKAGP